MAVAHLLRDLVDVEHLVPGEREVQAAPQGRLPQLLGGQVGVHTAGAQQEADCSRQHRKDTRN